MAQPRTRLVGCRLRLATFIDFYLVVLLKTHQLPKYHHMILNQMEMIDVEVLQ